MSKIEKRGLAVHVENVVSFCPFFCGLTQESGISIETLDCAVSLSKSELEEFINHLNELKNKMQ